MKVLKELRLKWFVNNEKSYLKEFCFLNCTGKRGIFGTTS